MKIELENLQEMLKDIIISQNVIEEKVTMVECVTQEIEGLTNKLENIQVEAEDVQIKLRELQSIETENQVNIKHAQTEVSKIESDLEEENTKRKRTKQ